MREHPFPLGFSLLDCTLTNFVGWKSDELKSLYHKDTRKLTFELKSRSNFCELDFFWRGLYEDMMPR